MPDSISLQSADVAALAQRVQLIESYQAQKQAFLAQQGRLDATINCLLEGLTLHLVQTYGIKPEDISNWHLDLSNQQLAWIGTTKPVQEPVLSG